MDESGSRLNMLIFGTLGAASLFTIISSCRTIMKEQRTVDFMRREQIQCKRQSDLGSLIGAGKRVLLLKMHCERAEDIIVEKQVGSLQVMYNKYPIPYNLTCDPDLRQWKSQEFDKKLEYGLISDRDVFTIKHDYARNESNTWMDLTVAIGTVLSLAANAILNIFAVEGGHLFLDGPTVGVLTSTFNLVTGCPIVVECTIEDGVLIPQVMGLTKASILNWHRDQQHVQIFSILVAVLIFCYSYRQLRPVKKQKIYQEPIGQLLNAEVDNDLMCIICMNKCRNIIFRNCRHFAICQQCRLEHEKGHFTHCPLCRKEINNQCILVEEYDSPPRKQ